MEPGPTPDRNLDCGAMEATTERLEPRRVPEVATDVPGAFAGPAPERAVGLVGSRMARVAAAGRRLRWTTLVYLSSRVLLLLLAVVDSALQHRSLSSELTNWDGFWYLKLASNGYPTHVSHLQTTLGFFPLYPMVMWLVAHVLFCPLAVAGLLVSGLGGLVATVLVQRLCTRWWGEQSGRRAVVLFCLFPGSVVFSMVYSEGLLIPLVAGCVLALEQRRWLLAGILAAVATAVGPDALAIVPACAVSSLLELRKRGLGDRDARKSVVAPLLAPIGIAAVGVFLWIWAGSPFATFDAQRYGWGERTDPFALVRQARTLAGEVSLHHFDYHNVNLNLVAGLLGAVVLLIGLVLLLQAPRLVSVEGLVWTLGVAFLTVTSEYTPPNPRLLITAFPAVLVIAHRVKGRRFTWLVGASAVLLVLTSAITYVGIALRP